MLGICSQDTALSNVILQVRFYTREVLSVSGKPVIPSGIKRLRHNILLCSTRGDDNKNHYSGI